MIDSPSILFRDDLARRELLFRKPFEMLVADTPEDFFANPRSNRARDFLGKILNH